MKPYKNSLLIVFLLSIIYSSDCAALNIDSLLTKLDETILAKKQYDDTKMARINQISKSLNSSTIIDLPQQYRLKEMLFDEYKSFRYDSAFRYAVELNDDAQRLGDVKKIEASKVKLGFVFLSSGLFKEAIDTLSTIRPEHLSTALQIEFYTIYGRTYHDLADYNGSSYFSEIYNKIGNTYLNKSNALTAKNSCQYKMIEAQEYLKAGQHEKSREIFEKILSSEKLTEHQRAIATSTLGYVYTFLNRKDKAIEYLAIASINDIKSSTKETVALRNLANLLYQDNDVARAYRYIKIAMEDAEFYNARHRKMEVGNILPIIEGEQMSVIESQKTKLMESLVIISLLGIVAIILLIISIKQYNKIRRVKELLQDSNNSMREANKKLSEANRIKEKYIGYYFNVNATYLERIEKIQKALNRKIISRQFDDLQEYLKKDLHLEQDREDLNHSFDKTFLSLFPNFVTEFNSLFAPADQIILKDNELLNNELRIFALIRMGISDNEKIAKILNYSVNTIYTYKTKIKNRSKHPNDDFEELVMRIDA